MDPNTILIVDDEKEIRELLKRYLERERFGVDIAENGEEALRLFSSRAYVLVILDVMLPGVDGIEVCRRLRQASNVPVLMLTAKDQETDKVVGLSIGADDYITKPFSITELVARVKALVRRYRVLGSEPGTSHTALRCGDLVVNPDSHQVLKAGAEVSLTAREFELLTFFMNHPGRVFTAEQLFRQVWVSEYIEDDNTVMVHIRRLRKKIEDDPGNPRYIQTLWGIGYLFKGERDA